MSLRIQSLRPYKWRTRASYRIKTRITGHVVDEPYYKLSADGTLWIRKGYAWNGTSGGVPDTRKNLGASLIHDVFYQAFREGNLPRKLRDKTDRLFAEHCIALGTPRATARLYYWALKNFAKKHARTPQRKVAPERDIPMP